MSKLHDVETSIQRTKTILYEFGIQSTFIEWVMFDETLGRAVQELLL